MALGVEVVNHGSTVSVSSFAINLSTSGTNRIAFLGVHIRSNSGVATPTVTGVTDGNGLTWTKYTHFAFGTDDANFNQRLEIWWAYAAAAQSLNPVTVTLSASALGIGLMIAGISGVPATRFTQPFDVDPTLPATASNPSAGLVDASVTFSTHDQQTVGIFLLGSSISNSNDPDDIPGWTHWAGVAHVSPTFTLELYTKVFNDQQISITPTTDSPVGNWGVIGAAIGGNQVFPHSFVNCAGF